MNRADLLLRIRALFLRRRVERELQEELNAHLELETLRGIRRGLSEEEARRAARAAFGGAAQVADECRDQRRIGWIEDFGKDAAYAARQFRKSPGFFLVAAATLAIGIGAASAMFSTVHGVLLRPFPYVEPDRLAAVWCSEPARGVPKMGCALPDLREFAARSRSFAGLAGYYYRDFNLTSGTPERVAGQSVSVGLFRLLGVNPALGRTFTAEEETFGRHQVVILSDALWRRRFAARAGVIGESVRLNGVLHTIVGVMPADFQFPENGMQLWTPISFAPDDGMGTRGNHFINAVARLRPGVSVELARSDVQAIARRLQKEFSENIGLEADASDYTTAVLGDVRPGLRILFGAVGILLLIACVNVANLLLARAAERGREFSIRAALGAGRGRLVRQLAGEGVLLGLFGACLGVLLSIWLVHLIRTFGPESIPRLQSIGIDVWTLAFAAFATLSSVLLFGLAPALKVASRRNLVAGMRAGRSRDALVVAEITLSLVLVIGAGLLVRTVTWLAGVDPGFQPENLLSLSVTLPSVKYPESEPMKTIRFYEDLTHRLEQIPGVRRAAAGTQLPVAGWGGWGKYFTVEERPAARMADVPLIQYRQVTPGYLRALGIRLLEGRFFTEQDGPEGPLVGVINEAARRRFFENRSPVGKRVFPAPPEALLAHLLPSPDFRVPRLTIVGVIGDVRQSGLARPAEPELYVLHRQGAAKDNETPGTEMFLFLRTAGDPLRFAEAARKTVAGLDPEQPVAAVATMRQRVDESIGPQHFQLFLFGAFAAVALALAAVGVYGVMSCLVRSRLQEIGIRMALGASPAGVLGMVVRHGLRLGAAGIALGALFGLGATRLMSSLLFGVQPDDAPTFLAAAALLAAVVVGASLLPSLRAARTDPLSVLRAD